MNSTTNVVVSERRTIGRPTRAREVAGALVLLVGAVVLAALTWAGIKPYGLLLALGAAAVLAWLVDGTSKRYLGPGLVALAAGLGITIGTEASIEPYEHTLVYGGFGLALLLISYVNPKVVGAAGAFLLYTGVTVAIASWVVSFTIGWELAAILAVWAAYELVRIAAGGDRDQQEPTRYEDERGRPETEQVVVEPLARTGS